MLKARHSVAFITLIAIILADRYKTLSESVTLLAANYICINVCFTETFRVLI